MPGTEGLIWLMEAKLRRRAETKEESRMTAAVNGVSNTKMSNRPYSNPHPPSHPVFTLKVY